MDAGISCRMTERRMARLGLSPAKVQAIFITHEHTDHTKGAEVLSRKYRIPVYITEQTLRYSRLNLAPELVRPIHAGHPHKVGDFTVDAFPKSHDAADPHSMTVSYGGLTAGVFTDMGVPCPHVIHHMGQCHAAFLESNYDEGILDRGSYPLYLKRRIRGEKGHLSNLQALELFVRHRNPGLKLLILSHLSAENNHPRLVEEIFAGRANGTKIVVASRYEESEVYSVHPG